jgi:iron(III) transport system ATP-binding protein
MFLSLQDITKRFDRVMAVDGVRLEISEGELVLFLGPSGCGKTTLLRVIAGLEVPQSGKILLNGKDLAPIAARSRNFGMVFQSYSLFPNMTVTKNVAYGLECNKWDTAAIRRRVGELLGMMHLEDQKDKYPSQLSGGQQQRVALARALAPKPLMLLLDEPLSALDAQVRAELRGELRELQRELRITTIMVTHDQQEAMEMAERIVVMNQGRVEQVGTPAELYHRPANLFVAAFLGHMNVLRVDWEEQGHPRLAGRLLSVAGKHARGAAHVYVRPEAAAIAAGPEASGANCFPARVQKSIFLGNLSRVQLELAGQPFTVELQYRAASALQPGQEVAVHIPPEAILVLA